MTFFLQFAQRGGRSRARRLRRFRRPSTFAVARGLFARSSARTARLGLRQLDAGTSSFREPDRNRLLGRPCAVLALANVLDLLTHEFSGLCGRRLALALVPLSTPKGFSFRHESSSGHLGMQRLHPPRKETGMRTDERRTEPRFRKASEHVKESAVVQASRPACSADLKVCTTCKRTFSQARSALRGNEPIRCTLHSHRP